MKALLSLLVLGVPVYFFSLAYMSQAKAVELVESNQLKICSSKPNCVCSECDKEDKHYITPVMMSSFNEDEIVKRVQNTLETMGATITVNKPAYIAATFTSSLFRFVDDFEIRIDAANKTIHVRSASRVGYSDFGVNRKRVEKFRTLIRER